MIEKQGAPGSCRAWKRKDFFPAVQRHNWELVAWHEGSMDAANGIFGR